MQQLHPSHSSIGIGGSSLVTGISTLIASYIVRVFKFDMMQFGIIYTIIITGIGWVTSINYSSYSKSSTVMEYTKSLELLIISQKTYMSYMLYFCGFVTLLYGLKYIYSNIEKLWSNSKKLCKIDFHTSDSVHRVIKFFGTFPDTLDINHDSTIGLSELELYYQKNYKDMSEKGISTNALTFVQELRSTFMPNTNAHIPFRIDDIKISGTLHMTHKTENYTITKKSDKDVVTEDKKSVFIMTITLNIYKNTDNYNISNLYKYMNQKIYDKERKDNNISLRHLNTCGVSGGDIKWRQEYFYIGKKKPIEMLEKTMDRSIFSSTKR